MRLRILSAQPHVFMYLSYFPSTRDASCTSLSSFFLTYFVVCTYVDSLSLCFAGTNWRPFASLRIFACSGSSEAICYELATSSFLATSSTVSIALSRVRIPGPSSGCPRILSPVSNLYALILSFRLLSISSSIDLCDSFLNTSCHNALDYIELGYRCQLANE